MQTTFRKLAAGILGLAIVIIAGGPWLLYEWALSNVHGRPPLPMTMISVPSETTAIWRQLKEDGPVKVEVMTPYRYLISLSNYGLPAGARVAWIVARDYNQSHLKDRRMIWWHFSGAALTIWLTRNWSTEQLLSKAMEITERHVRTATVPAESGVSSPSASVPSQ